MTRYAKGTSVSADRSEAEIKRVLRNYDEKVKVAVYSDDGQAGIMFQMRGRTIRIKLTMPGDDTFAKTAKGRPRSKTARQAEREKAVRQRWRALLLVTKAKLEAIESGISTFDDEWLAFFVLPDDTTVGEKLRPQLEAAAKSGKTPPLMLGFSDD